jgi:hypothetical protein
MEQFEPVAAAFVAIIDALVADTEKRVRVKSVLANTRAEHPYQEIADALPEEMRNENTVISLAIRQLTGEPKLLLVAQFRAYRDIFVRSARLDYFEPRSRVHRDFEDTFFNSLTFATAFNTEAWMTYVAHVPPAIELLYNVYLYLRDGRRLVPSNKRKHEPAPHLNPEAEGKRLEALAEAKRMCLTELDILHAWGETQRSRRALTRRMATVRVACDKTTAILKALVADTKADAVSLEGDYSTVYEATCKSCTVKVIDEWMATVLAGDKDAHLAYLLTLRGMVEGAHTNIKQLQGDRNHIRPRLHGALDFTTRRRRTQMQAASMKQCLDVLSKTHECNPVVTAAMQTLADLLHQHKVACEQAFANFCSRNAALNQTVDDAALHELSARRHNIERQSAIHDVAVYFAAMVDSATLMASADDWQNRMRLMLEREQQKQPVDNYMPPSYRVAFKEKQAMYDSAVEYAKGNLASDEEMLRLTVERELEAAVGRVRDAIHEPKVEAYTREHTHVSVDAPLTRETLEAMQAAVTEVHNDTLKAMEAVRAGSAEEAMLVRLVSKSKAFLVSKKATLADAWEAVAALGRAVWEVKLI